MANIIITGGTGLVGGEITKILLKKGHRVRHLSRRAANSAEIVTFKWDIENEYIDEAVFAGVDYIIHLAGAGIADKRWTDDRKQVILESRVNSTKLLYRYAKQLSLKIKGFISASAIGYYGMDTGDRLMKETGPPGEDFLAEVTKNWESTVGAFEEINTRTVVFRIGIVLSEKGGALPRIAAPIKWGLGAPIGSGDQYLSWVHIRDLARMFADSLENQSFNGIYNAVAPNPATNREFTKAAAEVLNKPLILPNVPGFALKLIMGEMAEMILGGNKVSSEKVENQGFVFEFQALKPALKDLLK